MLARPSPAPLGATGLLPGGGDMGVLVRAHDWAATPLGPIEAWPQSLRTAVGICLESSYPMNIFWGPELVQIYNDAYRPVLGAKHPRALGQNGRECWAEIWPVLGPLYDTVVEEGRAIWQTDLLLEMDRYGYREETYFSFSYSPIRDDSGAVGGVLVTCSENTERVVGERRLAALRDLGALSRRARTGEDACRLAAEVLAEHAIDIPFAAIWLLDGDGGGASLAGVAGLAEGDPAAPVHVSSGADAPWPFAEVRRRREAVTVAGLRSRFGELPSGPWPLAPDQAVVLPLAAAGEQEIAGFLVAGVSPRRMLDAASRDFLGLVAGHIASNVASARAWEAERRRAEALAELDRAKTAFFSNVSHEFRTPLTLQIGPLEDALADQREPLPPAQRERIEVAHRNSLRLLRLVNTLLDFSRIEAGRMEAAYEAVDLAALTRDVASTFRSLIERAGLGFEVRCDPLPAPAHVDRDMWEKIVLNLLSNAFKFTLEGSIAVTLGTEDGRFVLEVSDTGAGIPAEELPHVFERFHRVRSTKGRTHEGTGIGLALVQELVRLHGGAAEVTSTEGRGTTVRVTVPMGSAHLPATRPAPRRTESTALGAAPFLSEAARWVGGRTEAAPGDAEAGRPQAQTSAGRDGGTARILLADDNADMREYAARLLGSRWRVTAVADGQAALDAALADPPDLVLSDVMMPGLDGFALLRALRADARTRAVPVLLLSARAGAEASGEGFAAGADDYLIKPFSARELLARVDAHLALARSRREALEREAAARAQAEEAFARLHDALEATNTVAFDWDLAAGTAEYSANAPALFGIEQGRTEVRVDIVHPDDRPQFDELIARAAAEHDAVDHEFRIVRPDSGELRWVHLTGMIWRDAEGRSERLTGFVRDVTERRSAEAQAQAAQRLEAVGQLAGGVAHEVNNALTGVLGFANLAMKRLPEDDPTREDLEQVIRSGERAASVTRQLLAYSRRQLLQPRRLELASVLLRFEPILRQTLGPTHEIRIELPAKSVWVHADPSQLEQVLLNLALNARDAMAGSGRLTVSAAVEEVAHAIPRTTQAMEVPPGHYAVLAVRDTGAGMDEATRSRLFEPFFTTKPVGQGTGLGLPTVYGIVRQSGGYIAVESAPGRGTAFRIFLPLAAAPEGTAAEPGSAAPRGRRETVLVVDDEPAVTLYLERLLGDAGYRVHTAASPSEALAAMMTLGGQVDLVISDVVMPGMSGQELGARLASERPILPVLYTSGYTGDEVARRGLLSANAPFIEKPLDPDRLLAMVRRLLDRAVERRSARG